MDDATLQALYDTPEIAVGAQFAKKFRIRKLLGRGGFGAVYKAHQEDMDRLVALKVMKRQLIEDAASVKRFLREVRTSSKLKHPNTVKIFEFGTAEAGQLFFTMEYIDGLPLSQLIKAQGPVDEWRARRIAIQILKSLSEAHSLGMVHRDLKPDNVMIANIFGETDFVKVLDFGIVKIVGEQDGALTHTGQYFGTPKYMSPEQARGEAVDHRADLYALGVILYEMLSGRLPFEASSSMKLILAHAQEPPPPLPAELALSAETEALVMRLLAKDPAQRFQSSEETIAAIAGLPSLDPSATEMGQPPPAILDPVSSPTPSGGALTPGRSGAPSAPHHEIGQGTRQIAVAGIVLIVLASAMALYFKLRDPQSSAFREHKGRTTTVVDRQAVHPSGSEGNAPHRRVRGVSATAIRFGMSAVFSGPSRELGRAMKSGVDLAFREQNEAGGLFGRRLELIALDDGYEPNRTLQNMLELLDKRQVFAFVGNVGTPTTKIALPLALQKKTIFFGAFTGADLLRKNPPDRYVFNFRPSYRQETAAIVSYFTRRRAIEPSRIAVFAQDDGFGDAGYQGVVEELARRGYKTPPLRVGYRRNSNDVSAAVHKLLERKSTIRAVVLVATYRPAARLIRGLVDAGFRPIFATVSFVGSRALADELRELGSTYCDGVIVTQVVPHYDADLPAVKRYRRALQRFAPSEQPSFVSLEGYLVGRLLCEGVRRAGRDVTTSKLIAALETMNAFDLGLDHTLHFGHVRHQASARVYATILDARGVYRPLSLSK